MAKKDTRKLEEHFLASSAVEIYGTPRRLAVLIRGLPDKQPDRESELKDLPKKLHTKMDNPPKQQRVRS